MRFKRNTSSCKVSSFRTIPNRKRESIPMSENKLHAWGQCQALPILICTCMIMYVYMYLIYHICIIYHCDYMCGILWTHMPFWLRIRSQQFATAAGTVRGLVWLNHLSTLVAHLNHHISATWKPAESNPRKGFPIPTWKPFFNFR